MGVVAVSYEEQVQRAVARVKPRRDGNRSWDDVEQEARIAVWKAEEKLGELHPGQAYQAAYWGALAEVKRVYGLRRAAPPELPLTLEGLPEPSADPTPTTIARADVEAALEELDPGIAAFVRGWLLEGMSAKEAAAAAGVSYGKAQTQWSRTTRPRIAARLAAYREDLT